MACIAEDRWLSVAHPQMLGIAEGVAMTCKVPSLCNSTTFAQLNVDNQILTWPFRGRGKGVTGRRSKEWCRLDSGPSLKMSYPCSSLRGSCLQRLCRRIGPLSPIIESTVFRVVKGPPRPCPVVGSA